MIRLSPSYHYQQCLSLGLGFCSQSYKWNLVLKSFNLFKLPNSDQFISGEGKVRPAGQLRPAEALKYGQRSNFFYSISLHIMLLWCGLSKSVAQRAKNFSNTACGRKKLPTLGFDHNSWRVQSELTYRTLKEFRISLVSFKDSISFIGLPPRLWKPLFRPFTFFYQQIALQLISIKLTRKCRQGKRKNSNENELLCKHFSNRLLRVTSLFSIKA